MKEINYYTRGTFLCMAYYNTSLMPAEWNIDRVV